ncbi:MAG: hypothetical protein AAF346_24390 [Pseudomonadota bacterium]
MTDTMEKFTEREEIEMLLPWYESGTLDPADFERVERFLEAHPEMRMQLELVGDERFETTIANEMLGAPSPGALDQLRAAIAAETPAPSPLVTAGKSLWQEIANLFTSPTPRAVQYAGIAAALALMLQAGVIGSMWQTPTGGAPQGTFATASGEEGSGFSVIVRFAPTATTAAIAEALNPLKGQIVSGPKPGGMFEVKFALEKDSKEAREGIIGKLKASTGTVLLVLPKG